MEVKTVISVIIPVYNAEKYICRCLDSIINNTYGDIEILCINDGSSDNSQKIIEEYVNKDQRVSLYSQKNAGCCAARNKGIELAKGEWLAFVDNDDWIHPQYFELLMSAAKEYDADLVIAEYITATRYNEDFDSFNTLEIAKSKFTNITYEELFSNREYIRRKYQVWGKIYKKSRISSLFPVGVQGSEDYIFNIINCINFENIIFTRKEIYYNYNNIQSCSHTNNAVKFFDCVDWVIEWMLTNEILNIPGSTPPSFTASEFSEKHCDLQLRFLVHYVLTTAIATRFHFTYTNEKNYCIEKTKLIFRKMTPYKKFLSIKDRYFIGICYHFPSVYCLFQIVNDKTMLRVVRNRKRQYKKQDS